MLKKYKVKKAYTILGRTLMLPDDLIYAELGLNNHNYNIFNPKTRKFMGTVFNDKFKDCHVLYREPRTGEPKPKKVTHLQITKTVQNVS